MLTRENGLDLVKGSCLNLDPGTDAIHSQGIKKKMGING